MGMLRNLKNILSLGPQGILDQIFNKAVFGAAKGVGGFVSGAGRGVVGAASNAHNMTGIGKVLGGLGYGVGRGARVVGSVGFFGGTAAVKGVYKTLPRDWAWMKKVGAGFFRATSREIPDGMKELGVIGINGRIAKSGVAWGIGIGAITLGAMKGAEDVDYKMGLKTLTNGIMDYQGVSLTPGSIGASYTPIKNSKKSLRDLGVSGEIGFALHNQRNSGYL